MEKNDICRLIEQDAWMMHILKGVRTLNLPDWWIGAGFVRSKVWDHLHGYTDRTPLGDIDVVYFDPDDTGEDIEKVYDSLLQTTVGRYPWSVTNQARIHLKNGDQPYKNSSDAIAHWTETPTCIGASLDDNNNVLITAPHGVDDLVNLVVRPGPYALHRMETYQRRVAEKKWKDKWPRLTIIEPL